MRNGSSSTASSSRSEPVTSAQPKTSTTAITKPSGPASSVARIRINSRIRQPIAAIRRVWASSCCGGLRQEAARMLRRVTRDRRDKVVVFGGSGFVGSRVLELWDADFELVAPSHAQLDVRDTDAVSDLLDVTQPGVVLNLAAGAHVDAAEAERGDDYGSVYALNANF